MSTNTNKKSTEASSSTSSQASSSASLQAQQPQKSTNDIFEKIQDTQVKTAFNALTSHTNNSIKKVQSQIEELMTLSKSTVESVSKLTMQVGQLVETQQSDNNSQPMHNTQPTALSNNSTHRDTLQTSEDSDDDDFNTHDGMDWQSMDTSDFKDISKYLKSKKVNLEGMNSEQIYDKVFHHRKLDIQHPTSKSIKKRVKFLQNKYSFILTDTNILPELSSYSDSSITSETIRSFVKRNNMIAKLSHYATCNLESGENIEILELINLLTMLNDVFVKTGVATSFSVANKIVNSATAVSSTYELFEQEAIKESKKEESDLLVKNMKRFNSARSGIQKPTKWRDQNKGKFIKPRPNFQNSYQDRSDDEDSYSNNNNNSNNSSNSNSYNSGRNFYNRKKFNRK